MGQDLDVSRSQPINVRKLRHYPQAELCASSVPGPEIPALWQNETRGFKGAIG